MKNACAHLKSEHAHNWAQKFKNACAHWHSTDLRGHDDPWTRRTRTALTGTEREASAHWLRESISAAALRTKVHGEDWTENKEHTTDWTSQRLSVGRVEQGAGVNPLTRRSIQYTFF